MTDEQIIKALEHCKSFNDLRACYKCPALESGDCSNGKVYISDFILDKAFDLINRQQAEIERLTEENKKMSAYVGNGWGYVSLLEFAKNQRAEAIKEFAERLKKEIAHIPAWGAVAEKKIDNLVKEMTEVSK